jgi:hypothetical protein
MPELDRPALVEVGRRRAFGDPLEGGVCFKADVMRRVSR